MATGSHLPSIIVIGLHEQNELHIIEGILGDSLPQPEFINNTENYKWNMKNKYYDADVNLCRIIKKNYGSTNIESAEAIIVYIDNSKDSGLDDTDALLDSLDIDFEDIEVKLLVCDCLNGNNTTIPKITVQEWCIEHGWEAVELNLSDEDLEDVDEDFMDSWGFKRMKQALHAHTWSNLKLKGKNDLSDLSDECTPDFQYLTLSDKEDNENETAVNSLTLDNDDMLDYDDEFSALFSSLGKMKERAESLPPDQRKIYAEQIAFAFLKSLGDDDED